MSRRKTEHRQEVWLTVSGLKPDELLENKERRTARLLLQQVAAKRVQTVRARMKKHMAMCAASMGLIRKRWVRCSGAGKRTRSYGQ